MKTTYLYFVKMSSAASNEVFHKIGITAHADTRKRFAYGETKVRESRLEIKKIVDLLFSGQKYVSDHPYSVEKIHSVSYKYEGDALIAEGILLKKLNPKKYIPKQKFSGSTECFYGEGLEELIINFMDRDSEKRNMDAPTELLYQTRSMLVKKEPDKVKKHLKILELCKS